MKHAIQTKKKHIHTNKKEMQLIKVTPKQLNWILLTAMHCISMLVGIATGSVVFSFLTWTSSFTAFQF